MKKDEPVSVLVPRRYVAQVQGFIAGLAKGEGRGEEVGLSRDSPIGWPLEEMIGDSSAAMKAILRRIAERAPNWVTTDDLREVLPNPRATRKSVRSTFGAFGNRTKNRYGLDKWPFRPEDDKESNTSRYRMHRDMAREVLAILRKEHTQFKNDPRREVPNA